MPNIGVIEKKTTALKKKILNMKKIRVAINGFGRIGRVTARVLMQNPEVEIVAINDVTDAQTMAHLFKHDSIHGKYAGTVEVKDQALLLNGHAIEWLSFLDPAQAPWKSLDIDVVIESTGKFVSQEDCAKHIAAGAKKVVLSAPPKDKNMKQIIWGINHQTITPQDTMVSNASCTTNCAAPLVKVIHDYFGLEHGIISTVHAYTSDQRLHDSPHKDLRRARAAAQNIIPTSTGASKAIEAIFPELKGKLIGTSLRVPVISGSITEFTAVVSKKASVEDINAAFAREAQDGLKSILQYSIDPLVSSDIIGNAYSSIFDAELTEVIGSMVKVSAWYDNESGYSNRLAELTHYLGKI